ncbi:hypothetical protein RGI86_003344 [Morganella morganii]|nr:hypothetical protein [Morganella morganii]ELA7737082.1 hypothetical protein [Morganella morganii]
MSDTVMQYIWQIKESGMAIKTKNTASPEAFAFRGCRKVTVCEDGVSRGIASDRNGKTVTFTTPKGKTPDFQKEAVFNILLKSMKTL